jgi:hypothetical protein
MPNPKPPSVCTHHPPSAIAVNTTLRGHHWSGRTPSSTPSSIPRLVVRRIIALGSDPSKSRYVFHLFFISVENSTAAQSLAHIDASLLWVTMVAHSSSPLPTIHHHHRNPKDPLSQVACRNVRGPRDVTLQWPIAANLPASARGPRSLCDVADTAQGAGRHYTQQDR